MSDSGLEKFILDKLEKLDDKLDQVREESAKLTASLKGHEEKDEAIHRDVRDMAEKFTAQLDEQCKALHEYNRQLEIHIRGVQALEQSQGKMWERVKPVVEAHEEKTVVRRYLSEAAARRIKIIAGIGTIAGSIAAVLKLFGMF